MSMKDENQDQDWVQVDFDVRSNDGGDGDDVSCWRLKDLLWVERRADQSQQQYTIWWWSWSNLIRNQRMKSHREKSAQKTHTEPDHDMTHNVGWVFSMRGGRYCRQNIRKEMLPQTRLWSVENGGKYCRGWRVKNISKDIAGEGSWRVFATLTCWAGGGLQWGRNMEVWARLLELSGQQPCSMFTLGESHTAVSLSRPFNLSFQICQPPSTTTHQLESRRRLKVFASRTMSIHVFCSGFS